MKEQKEQTRSLIGEFFHFVLLNIFSMVGVSCYILVDTFFIGNGVGADGLTALNLALPVFSLQQAFGFLFSVGCGVKYAILKAQAQDRQADRLVSNTLFQAFAFGTVFAVLINVFSEPVMILMGAKGAMIGSSAVYMRTVLAFTPFFLLNSLCNLLVKNDFNPRLATVATISGSLFNIVFDYIFIYPMEMGMVGAALATGFSPLVNILILSFHKWQHKNRFHFVRPGMDMKLLGEVSKLGLTAAITELASGVVVMIFNLAILKLAGNVGVAAYGVVANIAIVVMAIYNGIAQGMQPLVSHYYGKNDHDRTRKLLRYGVVTTFFVSLGMYAILFVYASPIAALFNGEGLDTLQRIATDGIRQYFSGIFFAGLSVVIGVYFNSREEVRKAFAIALLRGGLVMVPVLLLLIKAAKLGMTGVFLSFPVSEAAILAVVLFMLRSGGAKKRSWK